MVQEPLLKVAREATGGNLLALFLDGFSSGSWTAAKGG